MKSCMTALVVVLAVGWAVVADAQKEDAVNLLQNGSFETLAEGRDDLPQGWDVFTSQQANVDVVKREQEAEQAVMLKAQQAANANVGIFQNVPVQGGAKYTLSSFVINDATNALKGSGYGEMSLEWKDEEGKEIGRDRSKAWGPGLSKKQWTLQEMSAKAPSKAVSCNVAITLFDGPESAGSKGAFLIDNVILTVK